MDSESNRNENGNLLGAIDEYYATAVAPAESRTPGHHRDDDTTVHHPTVNEMYEIANTVRERRWWRLTGRMGAYDTDPKFRENFYKYFRYEFSPLGSFIACATLAVLLIGGQFFVPYHTWMVGREDYTGILRATMFFVGVVFTFAAYPRSRYIRESDDQQAQETEEVRERIRNLPH